MRKSVTYLRYGTPTTSAANCMVMGIMRQAVDRPAVEVGEDASAAVHGIGRGCA
ncbi:MAG TPA: hypothetical protein VEH62_11320 [Gemmatimonadales bacterium]|nr:hypothetical protein [Gemmatimonadales bacterium]